jgi:hypothetical protein
MQDWQEAGVITALPASAFSEVPALSACANLLGLSAAGIALHALWAEYWSVAVFQQCVQPCVHESSIAALD